MYDVIIIGSGVAGMTAALYALRSNKKVLVLERENYGGQIAKSPKVENYPTLKTVSGAELSDKIFDQIIDLGVTFELEDVESIVKNGKTFEVKTNYNTYEALSVVIANGVTARKLKLENEEKFLGNGVYYCAICDGPFFAGKDVTLVGDGNSAMQYALMLAGYCSKVTMVTMFDRFFGEKALEDAIRDNSKIELIQNAVASGLIGDEKLEKVEFTTNEGNKFVINTNALFVAIGQVPDNAKFANVVDIDKAGYIVANETCHTKTDGLFVAGDCRVKSVRQVATAIGDGAVAGTEAVNYINTLK
ncbi:MAG: FAD-dependent oxidoreductase [Clostridiales bacterium]|nr:FAD-dependent oxidoreductase [Clostridiales bacterium]